jgi:hypothetical protein
MFPVHPGEAFCGGKLEIECSRQATGDIVLKLHGPRPIAFEAICPHRGSCCSTDQLGIDADLVSHAAETAFQDVAHPKLAPDLFAVDRLALVGKGGARRDDEAIVEAIMAQTSAISSGSACMTGAYARSSAIRETGSTASSGR